MKRLESEDVANVILTGEVVSAYVARNAVPAPELPALVALVHGALSKLATSGAHHVAANPVARATEAQIRRSITPDHLVSFVDGKPYKVLTRHLSANGLDARRYRERYGLPKDYPMVAANHAALRSALARRIGLGRPSGEIAALAVQTDGSLPFGNRASVEA
ncbi:MucR family transcriptional regulator [Methylobacterium oxalidis]|uniref:MucR family transcriptional regulator n=1 Tax=Methylobacterium oxalidis TaxID=944322 RepID=UPI003314A80E